MSLSDLASRVSAVTVPGGPRRDSQACPSDGQTVSDAAESDVENKNFRRLASGRAGRADEVYSHTIAPPVESSATLVVTLHLKL